MNKTGRLIILLAIIIVSSCASPGPGLPVWLEGIWETGNDAGFAGETWLIQNDTLMIGQGLVNVDGHIMVTEEISIFISKGKMYYAARVSDQNNGDEILFKAILTEEEHLVFVNPGHDFPTRIVYMLKDADTLEINISGRDKEDSRTIELKRNEQ